MNPLHECNVVELRQYRLHAGQRDTLIDLFDREFIETQEALGMRVIGQFRGLDDGDRFVWLRGFANMAARCHGLQAFYGGPVWAAHRSAANATMIDSDNVLLLRPAWSGAAQSLLSGSRAATSAVGMPPGLIDVTIFFLREAADAELLACCRDLMSTTLASGGALRQGWYVTEGSVNDFPRLQVREGEPVLVGVSVFADLHSFEAFQRSGVWARNVAPRLSPWLASPAESHRLLPTARSALHA